MCKKHDIQTGFLRGVGYLDNARLALYDPVHATFVEDEEPTPHVQILSLQGNVSQRDGAHSMHLQCTLAVLGENPGQVRGGRLLSGKVADLEFIIDSVDDFQLLRSYDDQTGLYPWLNLMPAGGFDNSEPAIDRTEFLPGRLGRKSPDEPTYELQPDDTLEHPRLGTCVVVQVSDEDRASIRMESGRVAELHLGLLKLERTAKSKTGHQTFRVMIRRRD